MSSVPRIHTKMKDPGTGHASVIPEGKRQGWVNHKGLTCQPPQPSPGQGETLSQNKTTKTDSV